MKKVALTPLRFNKSNDGRGPQSDSATNQSPQKAMYEQPALAEKIPIKRCAPIEDTRYSERIIYESYKPTNLQEMRELMHFVLSCRKMAPNFCSKQSSTGLSLPHHSLQSQPHDPSSAGNNILRSPDISAAIQAYYNTETHLQLPALLGIQESRLK
jgi:hypothetical protein